MNSTLNRQTAMAVSLALVLLGAALARGESKAVLKSIDFARPGSLTCGIQEAIDALPAAGGLVSIPPGVFRLRTSVVLRNHVTLRGSGPTTILTRGKQAASRLTRDARKGETKVEVQSTEGFQVGDEVALMSDPMHGWYMAHPVIKAVQPRELIFTEPIASEHPQGLFRVAENSVVVNYFPFLCAGRRPWPQPISDVAILDLCIDGNLAENPGPWTDFTLSAVHLANVSDALVRQVTIRGSVGDGIGVQGGHDNRVESCLVERCRVHGLHPGTSLAGAVFANNVSRHNGGDGLYFCASVHGIVVTANLLHDNAASGIGGLGEGGDRFNVVSNNICRRNGRWGIQVCQGKDNVVNGNICLDNSQKQPGAYAGICVADSTHTLVTGNRCGSEGEQPTQSFGIEERGSSNDNLISGNSCQGNRAGGISIRGNRTQVSGNIGQQRDRKTP
jgi:parallel beta-helix repeat protein